MPVANPSHPVVRLSNDVLQTSVYVPDATRGFYRSTRFDWSGMVATVEHAGYLFYAPWFTRSEAGVRDFVYRGDEIVAGPESSAVGLAEEFPQPQGFDAAQVGGVFVKVGVGVLRRTTDDAYSPFRPYELVDPGVWTTQATTDTVTSLQVLDAVDVGVGYVYRKTVRLVPGKPQLLIEHELRNTGRLPIATTQYNHHFLTIDGAPIGPGFRLVVPFPIETRDPPDAGLATIRGGELQYARTLVGAERVAFALEGVVSHAADYDVLIEARDLGAAVRVTADRPMTRAYLWSIRSVISFEGFVDVTTAPGDTTRWTYCYQYHADR